MVGAVAAAPGLGSPNHIDHQRRAPEELAEHGPGPVVRRVPPARLARAVRRREDVGSGGPDPGSRVAGRA